MRKSKKHLKPKLLIGNIYFWMTFCLMTDIGTCAMKDFKQTPNPILFPKKLDMGSPFILCTSTDIYPGGFHIQPDSFDSTETFIPYFGTIQEVASEFANMTTSYCGSLNVLQMFSGKSEEHVRDYRDASAATDKSQYLNHITVVAHIANGIHLQSGLMNGKIPVDDLIKELLNLGSVKVSDIASFKPDKITALTTKLKETLNSLVDSTKFEKEAIKWNKLRVDSQSVGDVSKPPSTAEYLKEIEELLKLFPAIDKVGTELDSLEGILSNIGQYASGDLSTPTNQQRFLNEFTYVPSSSTGLLTAKSNFDSASTKLDGFNKLKTGPNAFKPYETVMKLAVDRDVASGVDSKELGLIKKNIQQILDVATFSEGSRQDIKNINELVRRRISSEPKTGVYTSGLPGGIADLKQLEKDVRDPWIGKVISVKGSNLNGLSDGLQPLFKVNHKLSRINEKLKTFVSTTLFESLSDFNELQDSFSMLKQGSPDSVDVLQKYYDCTRTPPNRKPHQAIEGLIGYVQSIADLVTNVNELSKFKITLKDDLDSFIKKLDSIKDINAKAKHLKETKDLADIKARVLEVKTVFGVINTKSIKDDAIPVIKTADTLIQKQDFQDSLKTETAVYKCLQTHAAKAEALSKSTQAIQNLRDFDSKQFNDIELASNTISQISKDLSETKSIPDTMKKEAKEATTEINKMPKTPETSKSIGQSASSLQYAYGLKDFDLSSLKNVGPIAKSEIEKILSPSDKTTVEGQWGDHKKHVAELEATVASIKSFETKLDISKAKTISAYGAPLENLATIPSAIINAKDKLIALDALIPKADPKNKDALEAAKKDLKTISNLDLDFSSRSSQFKSAPAAFKTFDDFLSGFLAVEHNQTQVVNEGLSTNIIFIVVGAVLLIGLITGIVFGIRWYKKKKEDEEKWKETKKNVEKWIKERKFANKNDALDRLERVMKAPFEHLDVCPVKSAQLLELGKQRYPFGVPCNPETAVTFKIGKETVTIHANFIKYAVEKNKDDYKFIATQGPMKNTIVDFWLMILHHKCKSIVMLCNFKENGSTKCDKYFALDENETLEEGNLEITTMSKTNLLNGRVEKRVFKIVDLKKRYKTHYVTHYLYTAWPDAGVPDGHEDVYELMQLVNKNRKQYGPPIVVHCSAGIGRTSSFIGMDYIATSVERNHRENMEFTFVNLRKDRWMGVQTYRQLFWLQLATVYFLSMKYRIPLEYSYTEQNALFQDMDGDIAFRDTLFDVFMSDERTRIRAALERAFGLKRAELKRKIQNNERLLAAGEVDLGNGVGEESDGEGDDAEEIEEEDPYGILAELFAIDRDELLVYILQKRLESGVGIPPTEISESSESTGSSSSESRSSKSSVSVPESEAESIPELEAENIGVFRVILNWILRGRGDEDILAGHEDHIV